MKKHIYLYLLYLITIIIGLLIGQALKYTPNYETHIYRYSSNDDNDGDIAMVAVPYEKSAGITLAEYLYNQWAIDYPGIREVEADYDGNYVILWHNSELRKRAKEITNHFISVASNVRRVNISKTLDTRTYVIGFIDGKGKEASLWLNENGKVESISEY